MPVQVVDEVLEHVHHVGVHVVEGDGQVAAAVHTLNTFCSQPLVGLKQCILLQYHLYLWVFYVMPKPESWILPLPLVDL